MTVSEYINWFFVNKGEKYIFGFQGSAMLKIVFDMEQCGKIKYIQTFHEQSASFAADAYSRLSNFPALAIATSGPGAINLLGGIADCYFDSVPCIFLTGQFDSEMVLSRENARQNGFQDMDIVSVSSPITKSSRMLKKAEDIAYELELAWYISQTGRKGPVLIDIPLDLQFKQIDEKNLVHFSEPSKKELQLDVLELQRLINSSKRPLIIAGGGVRQAGAETELKLFSQKLGIPVATTLMGIDLDGDYLRFGGLYGYTSTNIVIRKSDLLIICGSRMGTRHAAKKSTDYSNAKVVHIDIDDSELNRFFKDEYAIHGDLKEILGKCIQSLEKEIDHSEWNESINKIVNLTQNRVYVNSDPDPLRITEKLLKIAGADSIVTADVGQNQMWVAQAFTANGETRLLNSGGYGSMGFSLPAAIGASYAYEERTIMAFTGDGGFHMNQQELLFLELHKRNIKCIVFNNNCLGLMREAQDRYYQNVHVGNDEYSFKCVDLKKLAETYSIPFCRIESINDVMNAESLIEYYGPCLIEIALPNNPQVINRYDELEELRDLL